MPWNAPVARLAAIAAAWIASSAVAQTIALENGVMALRFDAGALSAVENKLTGETYAVADDAFAFEAVEFSAPFASFALTDFEAAEDSVRARYKGPAAAVEIHWTLEGNRHFAEKSVVFIPTAECGLAEATVARPAFSAPGLSLTAYGHPEFGWVAEYVRAKHGRDYVRPPGLEPVRTYFGRTVLGGFFTGLQTSFDLSRIDDGALRLAYAPRLRLAAGERLECPPQYIGVYRRAAIDATADAWRPMAAADIVTRGMGDGFDGGAAAGLAGEQAPAVVAAAPRQAIIPLPSESLAMTAMTSAILGPTRHGLTALVCGWHSQMEQDGYDSDAELEGDLASLRYLATFGVDGVTDSHPWAGETEKMAALGEGDSYAPGPRERRFLETARDLGLMVTQWPTMNNTHPWRPYGGPFRADRPEWLRGVDGEPVGNAGDREFQRRHANCFADDAYYAWLEGIALDGALGTGLYKSWCMDGDFWGTGAYFNTMIPATCLAENHSHLPGDANYAFQRQLDRMTAEVRRRHPDIYILMCRPPMDLGIWAQRNVDACFTLIESGTGGSNLAGGDEIRTASRMRVHHHFFPHWLDQSLVFPSFGNPKKYPQWPSGHIDYILLSALSSTPNLLLYLPSKLGVPEADRAEIRKWLDWGRDNERYLAVRKDLPAWPAPGVVDGSAHILGGEGLIFLFNSNATPLSGAFDLTGEAIGIEDDGRYRIVQTYPASVRAAEAAYGDTVSWEVPAETAVVLRIEPADRI